jgi:DnaJ-class molecular chaperone
VETFDTPFKTLIGCYFEMSSLFVSLLFPGSVPARRDARTTMQRGLPMHLHAPYRLLHLADEASLAEVRIQYREQAKSAHPDA